ncbi:MAG: cyclohydrolase [Ferruginibacter sp.]|nr:cyclohydrolase [Ferruginibacter sp.]
MFIIQLKYIAALEEIDAAMKAHMAYLKKYYDKEIFLLSGRRVPRNGGIILAAGDDKAAIKKIAEEDPFYKKGLSKFTLIQFNASQANKNIGALIK